MAILNGLIFPIFSIFFSRMLTTLLQFSSNGEQSRKDANLYALIFFILGIGYLFINFFQIILFAYVG